MPRVTTVQIHHNFHATRAAQIKRSKRNIYKFVAEYPEVDFIVSLGLETRYSKKEANRATKEMLRRKPENVRLVSSSITCPSCSYGGVQYGEMHTDKPTRGYGIASNDGYGIAFYGHKDAARERTLSEIVSAIRKSQGLKYYFLWWGEAQGIAVPKDRKIEARKRRMKMTIGQVREINKVLRKGV